MKKIYILKSNLPTFWVGDICLLEDDGSLWWVGNQDKEFGKKERELHWRNKVCMFNKKTIEKFKILESGWFEEMPEDLVKRIFPWDGCQYWYVTSTGINCGYWHTSDDDILRKSMGNCFLNKEDAMKLWGKVMINSSLASMVTGIVSTNVTKQGDFTVIGKFVPESYEAMKQQLEMMLKVFRNGKEE